MRHLLIILAVAAMLTGCALFKPDDSAYQIENIPDRFSLYSEKADLSGKWWEDFNSAELNRLVEEAVTGNFSISEAWARLEQARATAIKTQAALFPELSLAAGESYQEQKNKDTNKTNSDAWSVGLSASYEIDLWGRVWAEKKGDDLLARATEEDFKTALMTVTGKIAENWISLIANKKQQELLLRQLALQKELLRLIQYRFPLGKSTALDIYQQQQAIEKIKAALIPLVAREAGIKRQLALLLGKATMEEGRLTQNVFPEAGDFPAIGLPADLLAARPDVRAVGLRLQSAKWAIASAKADRLPALKLTASHTYSSEEFRSVFDNWLLNLAANLAGPIIDGRKRRMEVARTKAIADERLAAYGRTVFTAIKEVEDALAEEQRYDKTIDTLARQLALSKRTMREAKRRYLNGSSDFLNVLLVELNSLQVQQDSIVAEEKKLLARIDLYRTLGGSWMNTYVNQRLLEKLSFRTMFGEERHLGQKVQP